MTAASETVQQALAIINWQGSNDNDKKKHIDVTSNQSINGKQWYWQKANVNSNSKSK